jgi:DDE_Tnp_1-associated
MLLLEQLKQIPDHRGIQGRKHPLLLLMSLIVSGKLCGHEGYRPIADFVCQSKQNYRKRATIKDYSHGCFVQRMVSVFSDRSLFD